MFRVFVTVQSAVRHGSATAGVRSPAPAGGHGTTHRQHPADRPASPGQATPYTLHREPDGTAAAETPSAGEHLLHFAFGFERVYLAPYQVADTPFQTQW